MRSKRYIIIALVVAIAIFGVYESRMLNTAHSTFENYYKFRGCSDLIEQTETYGICMTSSGEKIKIVLIEGKWYLEGDGPGIW